MAPRKKPAKKLPKKSIAKDTRFVKAAAKQTKRNAKQVSKSVKAISKAIKGVKKASKKSSKKSSKKTTPKKTAKPTRISRSQLPNVIKLRNIKQFQGRSWASIVNDRELLAKLDRLKRPDEYFIGSVFGSQTHKFFRTGAQLIDQLNEYVQSYSGEQQRLIDTFTIAKLDTAPIEYVRAVDERIKRNKQIAIEERRELGQVFGKTTEQGRTKTFRDFARDAVNLAQKQQATIDDLLERLTRLEKKSSKKTSKKSSKKSTKKGKSNETKRKSTPKGGRGTIGAKINTTKPSRKSDKKVGKPLPKNSRSKGRATKSAVRKPASKPKKVAKKNNTPNKRKK